MVIRAAREVSQLTTPAEVQRALQSREEVTTTLICKPSSPATCFICTGEGLAAEVIQTGAVNEEAHKVVADLNCSLA